MMLTKSWAKLKYNQIILDLIKISKESVCNS
jgi:hypothetical protein